MLLLGGLCQATRRGAVAALTLPGSRRRPQSRRWGPRWLQPAKQGRQQAAGGRILRAALDTLQLPGEGQTGPLEIGERYSSEDWIQHVQDFPWSRILRRIGSHLSFNLVLSVSVYFYQQWNRSLRPFPSLPMVLCSTALGLLLVFRTTAAYERWQQGERDAYELRHHLQQLMRIMRPWLTEEQFVKLRQDVCAFPQSIGAHLTARPGAGFIYGIGPRDLLTEVADYLVTWFNVPNAPTAALYAHDRAQGHIGQVLCIVSNMERLGCEAVPRDYSRHTSRFLTVWMCTLPFVLLECGRMMPVAVVTISWALLGIEEIGHALEDPFNSPTQPVPVQDILESGGGEHSLCQPKFEA